MCALDSAKRRQSLVSQTTDSHLFRWSVTSPAGVPDVAGWDDRREREQREGEKRGVGERGSRGERKGER